MNNSFNYDDVSHYTLEEEDEQALIGAQNECTFMWSTKEGWPVGVIMSYVYDRGTSGLASQFCGYGCKPEEKHLLHRFPSPAKDVT